VATEVFEREIRLEIKKRNWDVKKRNWDTDRGNLVREQRSEGVQVK
jgi:hypothetical protein